MVAVAADLGAAEAAAAEVAAAAEAEVAPGADAEAEAKDPVAAASGAAVDSPISRR